ncbi:MAG: hypothetical protein WDZ90_02300 [Candidatus Paceibacterota bacterium]
MEPNKNNPVDSLEERQNISAPLSIALGAVIIVGLIGYGYLERAKVLEFFGIGGQPTGEIQLSLIPSDLSNTQELYYFDVETKSLKKREYQGRLTHKFTGSVSPGGARIAYSMQQEGDTFAQIYVSELLQDGSLGEPRKVTTSDHDKFNPEWSPSGQMIAYNVFPAEADAYVPEEREVYIADSFTGTESYLTQGSYPTWSPQGDALLVLKNDGLHMAFLGEEDTYLLWQIENGEAKTGMQFSVSPDGSKVVIPDIGNEEVTILNVDSWITGEMSFDRKLEVAAFWPVFSPDGRYIAMETVEVDEEGNVSGQVLSIYDLKKNELTELFDLTRYYQDAMWIDGWAKKEGKAIFSFSLFDVAYGLESDAPGSGDPGTRGTSSARGDDGGVRGCDNGSRGNAGGNVGTGGGRGGIGGFSDSTRGGREGGGFLVPASGGTTGTPDSGTGDPTGSEGYTFEVDLTVGASAPAGHDAPQHDPYTAPDGEYTIHWLTNDNSTIDSQRPSCTREGDNPIGNWSGTRQVNKSGTVNFFGVPEGFYQHGYSCTYQGQSAYDEVHVLVDEDGARSLLPGDPSLSLNATPTLLKRGDSTILKWNSENATSCTLSGTNGDSWSGTSGSETSSPIEARTTFTLRCEGDSGPVSTSVIVNVVPRFEEF